MKSIPVLFDKADEFNIFQNLMQIFIIVFSIFEHTTVCFKKPILHLKGGSGHFHN